MTQPEWGLFPDDCEPKMFWGARAICRRNRYDSQMALDILPDRQSFAADDDTDKDDFIFWLNHTAIPKIEQMVRKSQLRGEFTSDSGMFHCRFDDRSSGGYIYIGAWPT